MHLCSPSFIGVGIDIGVALVVCKFVFEIKKEPGVMVDYSDNTTIIRITELLRAPRNFVSYVSLYKTILIIKYIFTALLCNLIKKHNFYKINKILSMNLIEYVLLQFKITICA